jgi:transposase
LTAVAVPSATCEAARDLARAREQVRVDLKRCRHRLSKLLLRHGRVWERSAWTKVHREWQSGESDHHGSITKTGSRYARRILVEAAWHYARPPRIGRTLYERQEGLPDHVLQIARRAQTAAVPSPAASPRRLGILLAFDARRLDRAVTPLR